MIKMSDREWKTSQLQAQLNIIQHKRKTKSYKEELLTHCLHTSAADIGNSEREAQNYRKG